MGGRILTLTPNPAVDVSTATCKVAPTHKLRCRTARVHPGGGGINVARVVARLGGEVNALYPAGGVTGDLLERLLREEGVPAMRIAIAGETRESFAVHEETTGLDWRFVLPGPTLSATEWQACLDRTLAAAEGCGIVVASGSLPPGVPDDGYADLARLLAARGTALVLDTSGPALAAALDVGVHLVKPSLRELEELTGTVLPDQAARVAACSEMVRRGSAHLVALSLGAEGAVMVSRYQAWHAPALDVPVASTIGAGDSFLGGLVAGLARGSAPDAALAQAIATSAAALLTAGTALCRREDVDRLLPRVVVTAL
ncbi:MAG TPA: 1-phosphofructokinase family hexose kinase [Ramlibacter sp.]|nr:1-phosphofructokinase family hexose kinase [Ramlibacter sp.]